jgi:hypothetical protein
MRPFFTLARPFELAQNPARGTGRLVRACRRNMSWDLPAGGPRLTLRKSDAAGRGVRMAPSAARMLAIGSQSSHVRRPTVIADALKAGLITVSNPLGWLIPNLSPARSALVWLWRSRVNGLSATPQVRRHFWKALLDSYRHCAYSPGDPICRISEAFSSLREVPVSSS